MSADCDDYDKIEKEPVKCDQRMDRPQMKPPSHYVFWKP
jgi:hypothetical protein